MSCEALGDAYLPRAQLSGSTSDVSKKPFPSIDYHELEFVEKVARGGMAEISLYKWEKPGFRSLVAVKRLFGSLVTTSERNYLESEMSILNKVCHPHIVKMFGIVETVRDFGLVMEYLPFGSYRKFIGEIRENLVMTQALETLMIPLKIRIIDEIINAMAYLHGMKPKAVLHLDMKSDNVLLDRKLQVKICVFGLSRMSTLTSLRNRTTMSIGNVGGTPGYIAPERLRNIREKPTSKSDVYSFAILAWEIATDKTPYEEVEIGNDYDLLSQHICNKDLRPDERLIPKDFPEGLVKMMTRCWTRAPADRPSFAELQLELEHIKDRVPKFEEEARASTEKVLDLRRSIPTSTLSNCRSTSYGLSERDRTGPSESVTPCGSDTVETQTSSLLASPGHSTTAVKQLAQRNDAKNNESSSQTNFQPVSDSDSQTARENSVTNITARTMPPAYQNYKNRDRIEARSSSEREPLIPRFEQKCPNVEAPKHGNMTCSNGTDVLNTKCIFSCDRGYEIVGAVATMCSAGKWSDKPPICESACDPLVPVSHGNFFCTKKNFANSTCNLTCEDNHNVQGSTVITCQQNRKWSEPEPTCACPPCKVGSTCQFSIQWKDVSDMLDHMSPYGTIAVNYGGRMMTCTCHLHSITVKWSGVCTDNDSGVRVQCTNYASPAGSSKHAASELIRRLVGKKVYPEPCDPQTMETGC